MRRQTVSVIVPVFNESALIQGFLRQLRQYAPSADIVVVDGGSSDDTVALAEPLSDCILHGPKGRPAQMNLGAQHAKGEVLWFLHVDCQVPVGCIDRIIRVLEDSRVVGGYFRVSLPKREWVYRIHDSIGHHVGVLLRVRCGDHGIFCRRSAFAATGGYPDVPLMEDVELYRALHRLGKVAEVDSRLIVSTRRHEEVGPWRYTLACALTVALYCMAMPLGRLARIYGNMVSPRARRAGELRRGVSVEAR